MTEIDFLGPNDDIASDHSHKIVGEVCISRGVTQMNARFLDQTSDYLH